MLKKYVVSVVIAGLFSIPVPVSTVLAGVEPSPFQPEINQLGAVANILNSADFRVMKTMSVPPEPCVPPDPCKGLNGDVNRLEAIERQVGSTADMITSMINEVMGVEPSPFRGDLETPLLVVRGAAENIVGNIYEFMRLSTDAVAPEFIDTLGLVADSAIHLIETVDESIARLYSDALECVDIHDEEVCRATELCTWTNSGGCIVAN